MAKAATLAIDVVANVEKAAAAFGKLRADAGGHLDVLKGVGVAAGAAVAAEFGLATKAAMEQQEHLASLSATYAAAGLAASGMAKDVEEVEATVRRTGQSGDDAIDAYNKLVLATKDTAKAHEQLAVAEDLAAFKHVSVATAANAIIKAGEGSTKALKAMGIATEDAAGNALSAQQVMDNLAGAVKGQADAFGDTAAGKIARYKESMNQLQETIGDVLLPVLSRLLDIAAPIMDFLSHNTALIQVLVPIIAAFAGVIEGVIIAQKVWNTVQLAFNIIMDANPIGLVIVAIAALVAAVIYAYTHVKWFRDAVDAVWQVIQALASWITSHWQLIIGAMLGPIGLLIFNFDKVRDVIDSIIDKLHAIKDAASTAFGWLGKVGGFVGNLNPFAMSTAAAPMGQPVVLQLYLAPGDDFPATVYQALRTYQTRNRRPELVGLFGG
jgi:phage-related protein